MPRGAGGRRRLVGTPDIFTVDPTGSKSLAFGSYGRRRRLTDEEQGCSSNGPVDELCAMLDPTWKIN